MSGFLIRDTETLGESCINFRLCRKGRNTACSGRHIRATDNMEDHKTFEDSADIRE